MVRVNLINPINLADQHLIAEYNEILMLLGYVKKYPSINDIPKKYCLGKGHIKFFKNKLLYIKKRHELLKKEMENRGFTVNKTVNLQIFNKENVNDWEPEQEDFLVIKERLKQKLIKKPDYYRYNGEYKGQDFFVGLIDGD